MENRLSLNNTPRPESILFSWCYLKASIC